MKALGRSAAALVAGVPLLFGAACSSGKPSSAPSPAPSVGAPVPCEDAPNASTGGGAVQLSTPATQKPAGATVGAGDLPTVTGAAGKTPTIALPKGKQPPSSLQVRSLRSGQGPAVANGDVVLFNYAATDWNTGKQVDSTYSSTAQLTNGVLGSSQLFPAWNAAMAGQRVGSRLLVVAPPSTTFNGKGDFAQFGIGKNDTLVFVVDIVSAYPAAGDISGTQKPVNVSGLPNVTGDPGSAPTVTIPHGASAPTQLTCRTLIKGTGPTIHAGQTLVTQYVGLTWSNGKLFDSSFARRQAAGFVIGQGQVISGWDRTLIGQKVGSRLLLVVPPAEGYGAQGQPQAGIGKNATLVFVVDVLGASS